MQKPLKQRRRKKDKEKYKFINSPTKLEKHLKQYLKNIYNISRFVLKFKKKIPKKLKYVLYIIAIIIGFFLLLHFRKEVVDQKSPIPPVSES